MADFDDELERAIRASLEQAEQDMVDRKVLENTMNLSLKTYEPIPKEIDNLLFQQYSMPEVGVILRQFLYYLEHGLKNMYCLNPASVVKHNGQTYADVCGFICIINMIWILADKECVLPRERRSLSVHCHRLLFQYNAFGLGAAVEYLYKIARFDAAPNGERISPEEIGRIADYFDLMIAYSDGDEDFVCGRNSDRAYIGRMVLVGGHWVIDIGEDVNIRHSSDVSVVKFTQMFKNLCVSTSDYNLGVANGLIEQHVDYEELLDKNIFECAAKVCGDFSGGMTDEQFQELLRSMNS
jgi:hypothetical protein